MRGAVKRLINGRGQKVDIGSVSEGSTDAYGDSALSFTDSTESAYIGRIKSDTVERLSGAVDEVDALLYTRADVKDGDRIDSDQDGSYNYEVAETEVVRSRGNVVARVAALQEMK